MQVMDTNPSAKVLCTLCLYYNYCLFFHAIEVVAQLRFLLAEKPLVPNIGLKNAVLAGNDDISRSANILAQDIKKNRVALTVILMPDCDICKLHHLLLSSALVR